MIDAPRTRPAGKKPLFGCWLAPALVEEQ